MKITGVALGFCLTTAGAAFAEPVPADCVTLAGRLQTLGGWSVTAPPAGSEAGWCVLDGAAFKAVAADLPDLRADRLRLRGMVEAGDLVALDLDLQDLRLRPGLSAAAKEDPVRRMFRLQSGDLRFSATQDPARDHLEIRDLMLTLSGGTRIVLSADIAGAELGLATLASGRLMALTLDWQMDGRSLRPVMEEIGAKLVPGATGSQAVDAARAALREVMNALPEAMLSDESRSALDRVVTAVPVGRGRLQMSLVVAEGIGAARLLVAGVAKDPLSPETQAALFDGASLQVMWEPGLAP